MTIDIRCYNVTGGCSTDDYNLQRGHLAKFHIELNGKKCDSYKVKWYFCDGEESTKSEPLHIFHLTDTIIPCEANVWVKAVVTCYFPNTFHKTHKSYSVTKELVIIPRLKGDIQYINPPTDKNTKCIDLSADPIMEAPEKAEPFIEEKCKDKNIYLPTSEIMCTNVSSLKNICSYGVYSVSYTPTLIYSKIPDDKTTLDFYRYNYPNKHGKYPPFEKEITFCPINITLSKTTYQVNEEIKLKLINISPHLMPETSTIHWNVDHKTFVEYGRKTSLKYKFKDIGTFYVNIRIEIIDCPPIYIHQQVTVS